MICNHDMAEMDTACCADGLCPICLHAEVGRFRAHLERIANLPDVRCDEAPTIARNALNDGTMPQAVKAFLPPPPHC